MSKPKEEATGHQPPAEPLPDIYESSAFPGAWRCWRCSTFMNESNVEAHRARHAKEDAIAEASKEILRACQDLTEDDLIDIEWPEYMAARPNCANCARFNRLVAAIRARRALDPNPQD
jgi:hypothetical protein